MSQAARRLERGDLGSIVVQDQPSGSSFNFFILVIVVVVILIKFPAFLLPGLWSTRGLKYPWKGPRSTADCQVDDGGGDDDDDITRTQTSGDFQVVVQRAEHDDDLPLS